MRGAGAGVGVRRNQPTPPGVSPSRFLYYVYVPTLASFFLVFSGANPSDSFSSRPCQYAIFSQLAFLRHVVVATMLPPD